MTRNHSDPPTPAEDDFSTRSAHWIEQRWPNAAVSDSTPTDCTSPPHAAESDDGETPGKAERTLPGETMTSIGRFAIERMIGRGGRGIVYLASDPKLGRKVALKVPRPEFLLSADGQQRFLREGRAAAALDHPNLVSVYEVGEAGPFSYIVSAYCSGPNLAQWLAGQISPVPFHLAATVVAALADAVESAHRQGVLHRDLKPSNVLLERTDADSAMAFVPRITDFGLAKLVEGDVDLTHTGELVGTPRYMAPEQVDSRFGPITTATDVYGLGTILYELLTGRPPIVGASTTQMLLRIVAEGSPPVRQRRPDVPRDLEAICHKAISRSPSDRYSSAAELANDLHRYLQGQPTIARPPTKLQRTVLWCRRRPAAAALAAVCILATIAFAAGVSWHVTTLRDSLATVSRQAKQLSESQKQLSDNLFASDMKLADRALRHGDFAQLTTLLTRHRDDPQASSFEYRFLSRRAQLQPLRTIQTGQQTVYYATWSPDGSLIATAGKDGTVRFWDAATGEEKAICKGHSSEVNNVRFAPDGRIAISCSDDGTARIWDVASFRQIGIVSDPSIPLAGAAFAGDASTIAAVERDTGKLYVARFDFPSSGETQQPKLELIAETTTGLQPPLTAGAISPDGRLAALAAGVAKVWRLPDLEPILETTGPHTAIYAAALAPSGRWLAIGDDFGRLSLWDLNSKQRQTVIENSGLVIRSIAFAPDEKLIAVADAVGIVRVWSLPNAALVGAFDARDGRTWSVQFSADGRTLITAGDDGAARIWSLNDVLERQEIEISKSDPATSTKPAGGDLLWSVWTQAYAFDARTAQLATPVANRVSLWDLHSHPPRPIMLPGSVNQPIVCVGMSPMGSQLIAGTIEGEIVHWSGPNLENFSSWKAPIPHLASLALSTDRVAVLEATVFSLRDVQTGKPLDDSGSAEWGYHCVSFSPDGEFLALGVIDDVRLYNCKTRELYDVQIGCSMRSLTFSPDGELLAGIGVDRKVSVWKTQPPLTLVTEFYHRTNAAALTFSPDAATVAVGGLDGVVTLWNLATHRDTLNLEMPAPIAWLGYAADQSFLAAGSMPTEGRRILSIWRATH